MSDKSRKAVIEELANELGENMMVVAAFVGRMARKLGVSDLIITERLTALVRQLKSERNGN
ncbi:MAG: hypothetical protein PHX83_14645 [Acidobacteriia bacterium]|nr:hypothetical protein [Terriglobia bacterium]